MPSSCCAWSGELLLRLALSWKTGQQLRACLLINCSPLNSKSWRQMQWAAAEVGMLQALWEHQQQQQQQKARRVWMAQGWDQVCY